MAGRYNVQVLRFLVKDAVVSFIDKLRPSKKLPQLGLVSSEWKPRAAAKFSDLSLHKSVRKHALIGGMLGIENPFFREHGSRMGAKTLMDGQEYSNFASYDYLGLNQHPAVGEAAKAAIDQYGTSVSASRIVAGERPLHVELEKALAEYHGVEDAIAFVSGHATNVSTISTLMGQGDLIVYDEFMHNSAIVGARLSGATLKAFRHNDMASLEKILRENRAKHTNALVVVEGVYSMDGDFPDLPRLIELKEHYGAWLMIDEAHSMGVLGKTGRGIAEHFDVAPRKVDIWMGTLSKTLGACGGYIAGDKALVEVLKFNAPGFVYSVGLSPPVAAASLKALQLLKAEPERVRRMQENGLQFLAEAKAAGLDTGTSEGFAVVPVIVGDPVRAVKLTTRLMERGINAMPIIFPAVPMKASRVRFFITSEHTPAQISEAVRITKEELDLLKGVTVRDAHGKGDSQEAIDAVQVPAPGRVAHVDRPSQGETAERPRATADNVVDFNAKRSSA
ncbi:MAG: aminotransferase class I/II-fold pyridoxal phosphate-dependent enzyme [Hyphomicrobiaceae bacterium]